MRVQDVIDMQILAELRRDSRVPVAKLAEKVGRSRTAVKARLDRLEQSGQILAYSIREPSTPNPEKIGAIVLVTLEVRRECEDFLSAVKVMPEIVSVTWIIGEHDLALIVRSMEQADLEQLLVRLAEIKGVKHTETILALQLEV